MGGDQARVPAASIETPYVEIDLARVSVNVAKMQEFVRGLGATLRPHFKTHKSLAIAQMQSDAGATGLTCATLWEATVLANAGIRDIFLAFPLVADESVGQQVRKLHETSEIGFGVASLQGGELLVESTRALGRPVRLLLEVECGGRRTGLAPDDVAAVAVRLRRMGAQVAGIFTYPGHGYTLGKAGHAANDQAVALSRAALGLERSGFKDPVVSAGSTPTMPHGAATVITEYRPGTYVFGDRQQVALGSMTHGDLALSVATTVIHTDRTWTVVDAGAKSIGRDAPASLTGYAEQTTDRHALLRRIFDHHGVFEAGAVGAYGERITVFPNNANTVVNLHDRLWGKLDDSTGRRAIPVDARPGAVSPGAASLDLVETAKLAGRWIN
jgi:D-serine deaminase-like pyridoxal phosphate-dependent protein